MDASLTRMNRFLAELPQGLDSYPDHTQKASVFRAFTEGLPLAEHAHLLPPALQPLVTAPPPVHNWVSEVHVSAIYLASADLFFPDDAAYVAFAYERNRRVIDSPWYGVLFRLVGPERVLQTLTSRAGAMHRGITVVAEVPRKHEGIVRMTFPPRLVPELLGRCYATATRAAVEVAGGRDVHFQLVSGTPTELLFRGSWS